MKQNKLLGYYNYTVILTYIGMVFGFLGIVNVFDNNIFQAIICLLISGFCDMFDGAIAATKKRTMEEKSFGIQIDSLSDLICFGVLPSSIVYSMGNKTSVDFLICALYLLCCLIRLAYFNVDEQERQKNNTCARSIYFGLPVTLAALFIPLIYGITIILSLSTSKYLSTTIFLMSFLFLIPFQIKKPKIIGKICVALCGVVEILLISFAGIYA